MIAIEQEQSIAATIARMGGLSRGLGTKERACSVAAINLALYGRLTDEIPSCMSPVIGNWIIAVQDAMPEAMRNSAEWRRLLPLAAGTGREHEGRRIELIIDWMWGTVLQSHQPHADAGGYGAKWRAMLEKRTKAAARAAAWAMEDAVWESFAPADLLVKLIAVTDGRALAAKEGE